MKLQQTTGNSFEKCKTIRRFIKVSSCYIKVNDERVDYKNKKHTINLFNYVIY